METAPNLPLPEDRHSAFSINGWQAFAVSPIALSQPTILRWDDETNGAPEGRFRLSVSVDHRENVAVEAYLPLSGRVVGTFDIRYPTVCQPVEIRVAPEEIPSIIRDGLGLRMVQGSSPIWFIADEGGGRRVPDALLPHLLNDSAVHSEGEFINRMLSLASIQTFGWLEGTVLDGLLDLARILGHSRVRRVIEAHLEHYFDGRGRLRYINTDSLLFDERIYGIEGTLPFAVLAQIWPKHHSIDLAVPFWLGRKNSEGLISDGSVTSEGCYTVAYPLAVVGKMRSQPDLCELAIRQLRLRTSILFRGDEFYPQVRANGLRPFKSWGRGCVWYLLGHIRTLSVLQNEDADVIDACRRFADWVSTYQMEDGTWPAYVDEPQTGPDTSTTAGLGAAFAKGVLAGILPESYIHRASRALNGLLPYLTPDGFLGGASPENKGGETLQRSGYRCISQISMGLMAQLVSALAEYEKKQTRASEFRSVVHNFLAAS